jgi:LAGLIDADG-like domain
MDNPQVTEFEIGWLIGIYDGEGCYTIAKTIRHGDLSYTPGIKLVNTNFEMIEEVSRILKVLDVPHFIYEAWRSGKQKRAKRLEINGLFRIKKFLDKLFDRMVCRAHQAGILKDFVELRLSKPQKETYGADEHSLYRVLRSYNEQGPGTSETTRDQPS